MSTINTEKLTQVINVKWRLKPLNTFEPRIKHIRAFLRKSKNGEIKEKRLLEKELGVLAKSCKDFRIHTADNKPVLGAAIAALDEITDETVHECIGFVASQRELTSMDVDSFCWQAKFAVIDEAVKEGKISGDYGIKLGALTLIDVEQICREHNPLDKVYSQDPVYNSCTNETKALYRKMTSEIAVKTKQNEAKLSRKFTDVARGTDSHIGEIIFDEYKKVFPLMKAGTYITLLFTLAVAFTALFGYLSGRWWFTPLIFLPVFAAIKPIVDLIATKSVKIRIPLPQIDLGGKIPSNARTLCVISTLLGTPKDVEQVIKKLDIAGIKNVRRSECENLHFCALCDLKAGKEAEDPGDDAIIEEVRRKFGERGYTALIRNREYSDTQRCYQGKERKRGAIESLMKLLRSDKYPEARGDFREIVGSLSNLVDIRYVCALDYDTVPLMDSISELVGIALHPCQKNKGIITPRITTTLVSSLKTGFSRAMAGNGGCAGASSYDSFAGEFYQDCFGEGTFTGKGLIDVNIFAEKCFDRFPNERVLSHDILEGGLCGVAYAGDVEFSDSFPETSNAYFKRQHRWLRGDLQNTVYINNSMFTALTRFKLFDNVRRAITPIFIFACFFTLNITVGLIALTAVIMPFLTGFLPSVIRGRKFSNYRRFYSPIRSQTKQLLLQCLMEVLLLPKSALISLDALFRSVWRMTVSKRRLLDWTTAAAFDGISKKGGVLSVSHIFPATAASLALLVLATAMSSSGFALGNVFVLIISVLFLSALPVIAYCDRSDGESKFRITGLMRKDLIKNAEQIWSFYEDYVTAENNYLPPDNVQYSPVYRVTARTSPTNIGMYLLSCIAAKEFGFIDKSGFEERVNNTVTTIEKLDKWNGNLCNWYTTNKLEVVSPFISSVDSGNYVCCLVALNEQLKRNNCDKELIARVKHQIKSTDLTPFYNKARNLFSIGYDLQEEKLSHHNYDLLMSEARLLSYFAIATGQAGKRHWRSLGRVMGRKGRYAAPVAWTGTMFEYYMPELLLSSKEGSMEYEALKFCLRCQEQAGKSKDLPFGVSESGFYAFDRSLNYQYKAHGVQNIGLKAGLNREYVVSPYSSFLALSYDPISCYNNLAKLEKMGLCHERYGFYEAADFTKHRVGSGYAVVKSHMAHHVGMSMCAIANAVHDGIIQKLFFADNQMKRAEELMEEKIIAGEPVLGTPQRQEEKEMRMNADVLTSFSITEPRLNVLSNGRVTVINSDIGVSQSFFSPNGANSTAIAALFPTFDLYKPRGSFFAFIENDSVFPFYNHPSVPKDKNAEQCVIFTQNTTEYLSYTKTLKMRMDVFLDEDKPIEIRNFSVQNKASVKRNLTLAAYLEPVLARERDVAAHPAFMDLFIKLHYNETDKLIIISRKDRDSNNQTFIAAGFVNKEDFTLSFNREEAISRNGGIFSCLEKAKDRTNSFTDVPSPCVFIKTDFVLDAHGKKTAELFTCYGSTVEQVTAMAKELRQKPSPSEPSEEVISPLVANTIYGRLTRRVLGRILYSPQVDRNAVTANNLDVRTLWKYGISADVPIVLFTAGNELKSESKSSAEAFSAIIEMKKALSLCHVEFDLVILYEQHKQRQLCEELQGEINTEIFLLKRNELPEEDYNLIKAVSVLRLTPFDVLTPVKNNKKTPSKILPLNKCKRPSVSIVPEENQYVINEPPDVPWSNVIANSRFGTLVSDSSLGFTWALNSRECKLTPWYNDLRSDNKGEMLIAKVKTVTTSSNSKTDSKSSDSNPKPKLYDFIDGSTAIFAPNAADYRGVVKDVECDTSVRVFERGMGKRVTLELTNNSKTTKQIEIAYYTEPIIGVDRNYAGSRLIKPEVTDNTLILRNPSNNALSGAMTLNCDKKACFVTDKIQFWTGDWNNKETEGNSDETMPRIASGDIIGAVIVKIDLPPKRKEKIKFILSFTQNTDNPLSMEKALKRRKTTVTLPVSGINTGSKELDVLYKHWLPWQVIGCRMWARTGFYQNSGAYGFRDQLQDCLAAMLINPKIAKRQILRCCCAQFEEGDVLHWWHDLKTSRKGVRTRYSDDLLWLPYVVSDYVTHTDDKEILQINTQYAYAPLLAEHEHERYGEIGTSLLRESVYIHAKRAMEKGYNVSGRGLLYMGSGDWCDGYNRVGVGGKGESVWLCMFYAMTAKKFSKIAMLNGDTVYGVELEKRAAKLIQSVDAHCWDGEHYLRAFYDDGSAMGGSKNTHCRIDLLPQAFSVLADFPDKERVYKALNSALNQLFDAEKGIIKLFTPAFDRDNPHNPDPGYVMSYPTGVRENGGQYTHAAVWLALACNRAGMKDKAIELMKAIAPYGRGKEYKTEPYYLAADVYSSPKAYGRGGWSLYTGSSGWYYIALREIFGQDSQNKE